MDSKEKLKEMEAECVTTQPGTVRYSRSALSHVRLPQDNNNDMAII